MANSCVNPDKIPPEIKGSSIFTPYKLVLDKKGKNKKIPINPHTGQAASSTDPTSWTDFDRAYAYTKANNLDGIDIALRKNGKVVLTGMDFDHCVGEDGTISEWALKVIQEVDSYTERSPSKTGIRILVNTDGLPPGGRKNGDVEIYDDKHFLSVTGDHIEGTPDWIGYRPKEVLAVWEKFIGKNGRTPHEVQEKDPILADDEIINKLSRAKNADKFNRLFSGNWQGDYPSQSEGELAFCNIVAFYSQNVDQIDSIVRKSGLYREKWDSKRGDSTYGRDTILAALANIGETYSPSAKCEQKDSLPKVHEPRQAQPEIVRPPAKPLLDFNLTDAGNAESFKERYGDEYLYIPQKKTWFHFNGIRYIEDDQVLLKMLETMRAKAREAVNLRAANPESNTDDERFKTIIKWCLSSESRMKLGAASSIAESMMAQSITKFDSDPLILCCSNGAVDLRTGNLFTPTKEDYLYKSVTANYYHEAECPRFKRFMEEIFNGDQEQIDFVQKAIGYSLTGLTTEEVIFICYGTGANGKSVLLNTIGEVLGDYSLTTPASTFKDKPNDSIPNDIARMAGARFVKTIEMKEGTRLNEERIKALTGSDQVVARFLHNEWFQFTPVCKHWFAVNHKPIIRGTDEGIWRRIRLIPFEVSFEKNKDTSLFQTLKTEWPGILAWAVEGCLKWQQEGLKPVGKVEEWTNNYRAESDIIGQFLEEKTERAPNGKVQAQTLYKAYEEWCKDNGEYCISGTNFGKRLIEKGFEKKKTDYVYYRGLELL